ncbi:MAG: D-lactate dehydrogenase [Patiriisocius sp.]|jgi:D-lactate dehydrogenase
MTSTSADTQLNQFITAIKGQLPDTQIIDNPLLRYAYGTDASFYRLTPKLVVVTESIDEIQHVIAMAHRTQTAITFRAAGTSLSGQAVTDSVLVTLGRNWKAHTIHKDGAKISLQPGLTGTEANNFLKAYQRRIGPDPASIHTAKIGGITANNASGMCCGIAHNSYQTLSSMTLILADGTILNTEDENSREQFRKQHPELLATLSELSKQVQSDPELGNLIRKKYRLKNTTGYSINALLDYQEPIDILQHLMIGSEGTLGFIADVTLNTISEQAHKATELVFFKSIVEACEAVTALKQFDVSAVELIDRPGLQAVAHLPGMPEAAANFDDGVTALLIEISADTVALLEHRVEQVVAQLLAWQTLQPVNFHSQRAKAEQLWAIRKGLFPAVGAVREIGTTVIIEDVAFPIEQLAQGVADLHRLLKKYGYSEAVIFGHALDGNLHFVFTQSFSAPEDIQRYSEFMDELATLVAVEYGGSLKAEHGTGRNMAPFVELEWGHKAYQLMKHIKLALDPKGILNPGVILNDDSQIHLKNLKVLPVADPVIDHCIECGFCEPSCPSQNLTLTPRQRISSWREIQRLHALEEKSPADISTLKSYERDYHYAGTDTCAACGLCELHCPVNINTGDLTRSLRSANNRKWKPVAGFTAKHFGVITKLARNTLIATDRVASALGRDRFASAANMAHRASAKTIPLWNASIINHSAPITLKEPQQAATGVRQLVYLPACPGRLFDNDLSEATLQLLQQSGWQVLSPSQPDNLCCGMPYSSKGFPDIARDKGMELAAELIGLSDQGRLPIICDASPCSQQLKELKHHKLTILDIPDFIHDYILPGLDITSKKPSVALHVTCSSQRMRGSDKLLAIAKACASEVIVPKSVSCCGFAGDKGFTLPELNQSALSGLRSEIPEHCQEGYSSSRTCEIGLSEHSGIPYRHILYLLLDVLPGNANGK